MKHLSNSAWAKQGEEFAIEKVNKALDTLFWNPILTAENLYKTTPETYT